MTINLTITGDATTDTTGNGVKYDWQSLAPQMGDTVKCAWERAEYAMYRADRGQGPVPVGKVIPGAGSPWLTVCHHGTAHRAKSGNGAERLGQARDTWCAKCKAGEDGTIPLRGQAPADVVDGEVVEDAPEQQEPVQEPVAEDAPEQPAIEAPVEQPVAKRGRK